MSVLKYFRAASLTVSARLHTSSKLSDSFHFLRHPAGEFVDFVHKKSTFQYFCRGFLPRNYILADWYELRVIHGHDVARSVFTLRPKQNSKSNPRFYFTTSVFMPPLAASVDFSFPWVTTSP